MSHVYSKSTALNGVLLARAYEEILTGSNGTTYVGIGKSSEWEGGGDPPLVDETIENFNDVFRNLIAIKRIDSADVNLVVPDVRWQANVVYDQFNSDEEMYTHETSTQIVGRIDYASGNVIAANANSTLFLSDLSVGDIIEIADELTEIDFAVRREVIAVTNNYHAIINTSIGTAYSNVTVNKIDSAYPRYAKRFYARNASDQVFLCLFNNGGTPSNTEPVFTAPYSLTNLIDDTPDGYVWRYLYTVPSGLAEKFFYTDREDIRWIPVTTDTDVANTAVDGAIEHIRILNGGSTYNSNTPSGSADIITVDGDGINASYTAEVEASAVIDNRTTITNLLRANSGSGYTYATVTAAGGDGGAEFKALISPIDGFGSDPAKDLGAKFLGIAVEFSGTVAGAVPVSTDIGGVQFRQVAIINNIKYANNTFVDVSSKAMTTNVRVSYSGSAAVGDDFIVDSEQVATVVGYAGEYMLLNNVTKDLTDGDSFTIGAGTTNGTVIEVISDLEIKRSGEMLYIENIDAVTREADQVEVVKLVLKF